MAHENAGLDGASERELMFDPALKLRKIRQLREQGRAAEREYYVCSVPDAERRAAIRRELGVEVSAAPGRAVFLVTVECLRADHLGCNGYQHATSPAIDELAAGGVSLPRAYSTAGEAAQSGPGLLMSTLYQNFGRSRLIPPELPTLAEALSAAGFHTIGFNAGQAQLGGYYGYGRGFDEFTDFIVPQDVGAGSFSDHTYKRLNPLTERELAAVLEDCQRHPDICKVLTELTGCRGLDLVRRIGLCGRFYPYEAADIIRCALYSLLEDHDGRDRFYWLHMMDLHENITVPWSPLGAFSAVEQFFLSQCAATVAGRRALGPRAEKYHRLYDSAVGYVDAHVQILANFLSDARLLERSLICLSADHGQELFEEGVFGHAADRLTDGLVHVPLVFGGGLAAGLSRTATDRPVSTLDVAPTILDLCGIDEAPDSFLGVMLNDPGTRAVRGQAFYDGAECMAHDGSRTFLLEPLEAPVRECASEIFYAVEGGWQLVRDVGRDTTRVRRLTAAAGPEPQAERLRRQTEEWLQRVYRLPAQAKRAG